MTQGSPWKLLLRFSLPLMLGNVFQQLYMVVGHLIE
jgi:Na+-driven multidrug efflux pump